ncbi:MAG TPA: sulfite reductase subunit A [Desulfotomaculum sp.]|nr:sulfite reductase subunit A [Desulfotomaculum sp.]
MTGFPAKIGSRAVLERRNLQKLFDVLSTQGYRIIGPTVRDGVIAYGELSSVDDLPAGWTDEQEGAFYRLKKGEGNALFHYGTGPDSLKRFLYPPLVRLWKARREDSGFRIVEENDEPPKYAFIGVHPCDLHAVAIQDKVLMTGEYADPFYALRRRKVFVVAVNCVKAGGTCFCVSMKTGPKATAGFDLALTEILEEERHYLVAEIGSEAGASVLREIPHKEASASEQAAAEEAVAEAARRMGRVLDITGIRDLLYENLEHPFWDEAAHRCLTCGNCTMVCPTCFCTTVEDVTDLSGEVAARLRRWDSCFTGEFTYIHGGSVRASARSRYRQWLVHKLAAWLDQFGTLGCVGCGRCITWCPVGIDITAVARALREKKAAGLPAPAGTPEKQGDRHEHACR